MRRRDFLKRAGALALALPALPSLLAAPGCDDGGAEPLPEYDYDGPLGPEDLFAYGVASGDPLPDRVILWTRAGRTLHPSASPSDSADLDVYWEVAKDPAFLDRVAAGWLVATAATNHCVKVDAVLPKAAGQTFYYRFKALGRTSPMGRTRLATTGSTERLTFAVCSCSNMPVGYFHAYREIAQRNDLDLVLHLGDYIYEYGTGRDVPERAPDPPKELVALDDYRRRYAQYRRDPDLAEAHRQHPWVVVWDDHESANDSARDGAENHDEATEGPWADRKAAAIRAWNEWMPVRATDNGHIYRAFSFGDLVDLVMLDTRLWGRDEQVGSVDSPDIDDASRQLLGADQEAWLAAQLTASAQSGTRWTVIGQQVMMGQLRAFGYPLNVDQWDGYAPARQRFYDAVKNADLENLVVLTGDIHSSWAIDLKEDSATYDPETGDGALGVEVVVPGVTSTGLGASGGDLFETLKAELPHIQWAELSQRGYVLLDLDQDRVQATWYHFARVDEANTASSVGAIYQSQSGTPHFLADTAPAAPREAPPLAPV